METAEKFEDLEKMFSGDETLLLIVLNEMKDIINEYRIHSLIYLLKTLRSFPFSYKFDLNANPFNSTLSRTLFQFKFASFFGRRLMEMHPLTSDYETGLVRDTVYKLTPFGRKFAVHISKKNENLKKWRKSAKEFIQKISDNGYTMHIDRYASWVFLREEVSKTECKSVVRFYFQQHEVNAKEIRTFYQMIKET